MFTTPSGPVAAGPRVLGVDGCPGGWVGIAPDPDRVRAYAAPTLAELIAAARADGEPACVAVDIPIGLADTGLRAADLEAKRRLGARGASLFVTPARAALERSDYAQAVELSRSLSGVGFSRQAWGLRDKILEVDRFWPQRPGPLLEAHPELAFATMTGAPLAAGKKTWAGAVARLAALAEQGIVLGPDLGPRRVGPGWTTSSTPPPWPGPPAAGSPVARSATRTRRRPPATASPPRSGPDRRPRPARLPRPGRSRSAERAQRWTTTRSPTRTWAKRVWMPARLRTFTQPCEAPA
ncbi:MAG: hypothetical protein JWP61_142 [Friedmanniella sp.]|nr:hypothetical protein [Friedmanniella sp.]